MCRCRVLAVRSFVSRSWNLLCGGRISRAVKPVLCFFAVPFKGPNLPPQCSFVRNRTVAIVCVLQSFLVCIVARALRWLGVLFLFLFYFQQRFPLSPHRFPCSFLPLVQCLPFLLRSFVSLSPILFSLFLRSPATAPRWP